jgi:hypothetical protein
LGTAAEIFSYTGTSSSDVTMEGVQGKGGESPNKVISHLLANLVTIIALTATSPTDDHNRMKAHLKRSVNLSTVVNRDIKVNGPLTFST